VEYLRNCWYMAGWAKDFAVGQLVRLTVINERLVIYRRATGPLVALEDRCAHRLAPLSAGRQEGDDLRCMYHGLKYAPDANLLDLSHVPYVHRNTLAGGEEMASGTDKSFAMGEETVESLDRGIRITTVRKSLSPPPFLAGRFGTDRGRLASQ
jgi:phenylpropionate dioxygenase-like ring-hydroxylating dioxygenase large terminal subunit